MDSAIRHKKVAIAFGVMLKLLPFLFLLNGGFDHLDAVERLVQSCVEFAKLLAHLFRDRREPLEKKAQGDEKRHEEDQWYQQELRIE